MKHILIKTFIGSSLLMVFAGCSKILEETPHSGYTPEYFKTASGVVGGITAEYQNLRNIYGQAYYYNSCQTGTDEATYAQSADQNFKDMDCSGQGSITSSSSRSDVLWNTAFTNGGINNASGIIEYGTAAGVAPSLLAEARFFRAFYYFQLVQTFGGVPLDLGSGDLKFNITPTRISKRNTVAEVYTKAIFPDLDTAIANLPVTARLTGTVTKNVARLYLAKAYLTYGWWLQNPNNIPTYPDAQRTDPAGRNAAWYFQQAYNIAVAAIQTPAPYGLQPTFYDVNVGSNDRNSECLLYADHTQQDQQYNGASLTYSNGGAPDNFAGWMHTWNYTNIRSAASPTGAYTVSSVQRAAIQSLGRPWTRMAVPIGVVKNTFADKTNDSRYDGTFTTVYRSNIVEAGMAASTVLYNANALPIRQGDSVLSFLNDEPGTPITYPTNAGSSGVGAGVLAGRADWVISPEGINRLTYPGLWKLGPYRTDYPGTLGQPNAASTRPFVIAKFSEFFFIAAEAAVKGATTAAVSGTYANDGTARGLINVIRARAGKWKFSNARNIAIAPVVDNSAAMIAATPATIDINYILAERSREYFGEGYRWFDLVRTQTWAAIAGTYRIGGVNPQDHTPVTVTRTIPTSLYLRPIPQGQLDAMQMSADEKKAYQNPGYN